jgi:gliding motility-associated protein GldM
MAGGKISPRQKMINMMYLVLTALLALNVSKEVLNSFFEVNLGIERSTTNFNAKNGDTYAAFDAAAELNKVKAGPFRDQAYEVKANADELVEFIQEMKYNLVLAADNKVYLGSQLELKDEDGDLLEDKAITTPWDELSDAEKKMTIGNLSVKDDRHASGDLFYSAKRKKNIATDLKNNLISYKNSLLSISDGNESIITTINETCNYDDKKVKGKKQLWEEYNFYDMPSVGALTLLSKMQSDVRNTEADIINMLRENIDAGALKFTSAEGISIPQSNFVLRGDSFRAQIFISAKDTTQAPMIYVGEYDSLGNGNYQMKGTEGVDYNSVKVVNGKGIFSERASSEGMKKWGGLIAMKTANGTKMYPFNGEYLVAAKTAVVSPTNMNILYLEVDNPLKISVPGYTAGEISAVISNGKVSATKRSLGEYSARPSKKGKAVVSLYAKVEGKRTKMGQMEFRVKEVPPPKAKVQFAISANGVLVIDKMKMVNAGGLGAELKDFDFKGVRYVITSYRLSGVYKGEQMKEDTKGPQFTSKMINIIKNTKSGNAITISNIKAKRVDAKNTAVRVLDPLVIEIK